MISSRATSPPPIPTMMSLFSTMALDVGDNSLVPATNPPQARVLHVKNVINERRQLDIVLSCLRRHDSRRYETFPFRHFIDRADAFRRGADVHDGFDRVEFALRMTSACLRSKASSSYPAPE